MSCIAGTQEDPQPWVRYHRGEPRRILGRICSRPETYTTRRDCSSCVCFRGRRLDGTQANGLNPDTTPMALREREAQDYEAAMERVLLEDDFSLITAWQDRMVTGLGDQTLLAIGDPDAMERRRQRVAEWRARNPERARELNAAHAAAYRSRQHDRQ